MHDAAPIIATLSDGHEGRARRSTPTTFTRDHRAPRREDAGAGASARCATPSSRRRTSRAWCWSAARRACRRSAARSPSSSASRRSPISIRTRSWRSAPRSRRTCSRAIASADDDWLLLDVIPLSLGLETMGGLAEKIIPRNSTIPVARAQEFTTFKDGQTAMAIHVVQGEREKVADCRSLARFELRGIPPMSRARRASGDVPGRRRRPAVGVARASRRPGVEASIAVKPSYGLSDGEIARMLQESFAHAADDMQARALAEAQVEADQLVAATRAALAADGDLLDADERARDRRRRSPTSAALRDGERSPSRCAPPSKRSTARPASSPRGAWTAASRAR